MIQEKSCGAVVYSGTNDCRNYLIIQMHKGHWSFPKGHVEPGEAEWQTARREIQEETGLELVPNLGFRQVITYAPAPGRRKDVVFFTAFSSTTQTYPQPEEVQDCRWLSYHQARELLTYDSDKAVLDKAEVYLAAPVPSPFRLLITAFDPFGGEAVNPAQEAVQRLPDFLGPVQLYKLTVPTVFRKSIKIVSQAIAQLEPDAVLCIGQAGGRQEMTPERVAINVDDARIPDNAGNQPVDTPIFADGKNAYFSTLPIKAMATAMQHAGIPAAVSNSAGTFVCNHLMYGVLHTLEQNHPGTRGGFLHVPFLPEQAAKHPGCPSLTLEEITRGLTAAIIAIADCEEDDHTPMGTIS